MLGSRFLKKGYFWFNKMYFTKEHEWIKKAGENYLIGISHYAQDKLGEVVYLDFPLEDMNFQKNQEIGEIESSKAVSVIYSPVDIQIVQNNLDLEDDYSLINKKPEEAWLYEVKVKDENQLKELMNREAYEKYISELK